MESMKELWWLRRYKLLIPSGWPALPEVREVEDRPANGESFWDQSAL